MKWYTYPKEKPNIWRRWFAWYPVEFGTIKENKDKPYEELETVWLEMLERRLVRIASDGVHIYEHRKRIN